MKEALKLALEALENLYVTCDWHGDDGKEAMVNAPKAIAAIKEALAQPAQEPDELTIAYMSGLYDGKKKRPWVGLTDDEIKESYAEAYKVAQGRRLEVAFAQVIDAKLKEKNT